MESSIFDREPEARAVLGITILFCSSFATIVSKELQNKINANLEV